jgi:hypothetical protein
LKTLRAILRTARQAHIATKGVTKMIEFQFFEMMFGDLPFALV